MNEPPPIRDALEREGLWAKKSFGQHFLLDLNITRRIAREAGPLAGRPVLEIGPGPGGLTRALLEAGAAPLIVIEKDRRFLPLLEELVPWSQGRLRIVEGDALDADEAALLAGAGPAAIVSNLPYNVGTPLLVKWLKATSDWRGAMTLMFQKEVAERVVARVGDEAYGRLAVLAQSVCSARIVMRAPARAFVPPPKVDSAVVRLDPLPAPYPDLSALETVTAAAFGQRRKMLRSSLAALGGEALLAAADVPATARAEEIDIAGFQRLASAFQSLK
jgi:16S rRNA (adenine1518-N6/adenine1519-N6)-dimethyltransferase